MNKERKLIIAGNWKMNKTVAEALALVSDLKLELAKRPKEVDIVICPPFTALESVSKAMIDDSNIRLGAQNMSENNFGAFTGEICAGMLKEFSVRYVILGHSERRQYQKESDALIAKKASAAHAASLKPIVCVGETLAERERGRWKRFWKPRCAAAWPA
jgi:triosephosphate isomerase (TIM)